MVKTIEHRSILDRIGIRCLFLFLVCMTFCWQNVLVFAAETETVSMQAEAPAAVVADDGGLLMEEERDWLRQEAQAFGTESGWNVVLATCEDAGGKSAQAVCEDFFNQYTVGDDGVSCLIDMDNREIYLATAGDARLYLTDARIESILEEAFPAVSDGDYSECLYSMLYYIREYYEEGIPANLEVYDEDTKETYVYDEDTKTLVKKARLSLGDILLALGAGALTAGCIFGIAVSKYKMKLGTYKYDFKKNGTLNLHKREDTFINTVMTHRHIPKNTTSSGSGGTNTSSVHSGSGGRSFGGGGKKF